MATTREFDGKKLLRRYEPLLRFTAGERFFPTDVRPYIERAGLWTRRGSRPSRSIVPSGDLRIERMADLPPAAKDEVQFLRFTSPLSAKDLAAYALKEKRRKKDPREIFHAGRGRLVRVGYSSRLVDALFSISLLARGRVPGDLATAAAIAYREIRERDDRVKYYGRALRQDGWIILQYWFFYAFNDYRSRFFGLNDHEGDWEMISLFLDEEAAGEPAPEWVVYSCHEYEAVDLRRRWDDPEVEKAGDHPVVYVGAGSHASYFGRGEYLAEIELPVIRPAARVIAGARKVWHEKLRQYGGPEEEEEERETHLLRIPSIDYARGDGFSIGPGGDFSWDEPGILSPPPAWAEAYRGLWGYYAKDPLSSENAPSGPVYKRDGTVRREWNDPVGWCGLTGVFPPSRAAAAAAERLSVIERRRHDRIERIERNRQELLGLEIEYRAVADRPHFQLRSAEIRKKADRLSGKIDRLLEESAVDRGAEESLNRLADRLARGEKGPARNHIRRPQRPLTNEQLRLGRLAETWAAVSVGLLLLGFVALFLFAREFLVHGLLGLAFWFLAIELSFRGKLTQLIATCTLALALFALVILLSKFIVQVTLGAVFLLGAYILRENLRELWG